METPSYQMAFLGAGDRSGAAMTARLRAIAQMGAWGEISGACLLHKDPAKVSSTSHDWRAIESLGNSLASRRATRGLGFTSVTQNLAGPGTQLARSFDLATLLLAEFESDIELAAERLADGVESKGGIPLLWRVASSGGHIVPEEVLVDALRRRMGRPDSIVQDLLQPSKDDEASSWLFGERLRYLIENQFLGYDLTFLFRNDLGQSNFRSGREFDDIANVGLILWLAAHGPSQVNQAELVTSLKQAGPVAGVWGVKVPVAFHPSRLGRAFGERGQPIELVVRHQAITALERVRSDDSTSLTGLSPLQESRPFYGLVMPTSSPGLVEALRKAWSGEGRLTIIPAPAFSSIYAVRVASVDWSPLRAEVGARIGPDGVTDGWRPRKISSFGQLAGTVEKRRGIEPRSFGTWSKGGRHEDNGSSSPGRDVGDADRNLGS